VKPIRNHSQEREIARPRCKARFRGRAGHRAWCPGCGQRLVEYQVIGTWPGWFRYPESETHYYRCPGLLVLIPDLIESQLESLPVKAS
jgi:hypothetical protein